MDTKLILFILLYFIYSGLSRQFSGKESASQCRRRGFNPWVRKIPGEGRGSPLQYSCLGSPMDRGAWQVTAHEAAKVFLFYT